MTFYELDEYLIIIYYTDFTERIRNVKKENLQNFIDMLNKNDLVYDYVITRKMDYEY